MKEIWIKRLYWAFVRRANDYWFLFRLEKIAKDVKSKGLTYLGARKLHSLCETINHLERVSIPGSVYEFGVALGGASIIMLSKTTSRKYTGYDVFGLIPKPSLADEQDAHSRYYIIESGNSAGINGQEYYGYRETLMQDVIDNYASFGIIVDNNNIRLIKGLFEDTVQISNEECIALAHIDCDWYDPVLFCLNSISTSMTPGGKIIVDDYNDYIGCKKATNEFLTKNPNFILEKTAPHAIIRFAPPTNKDR